MPLKAGQWFEKHCTGPGLDDYVIVYYWRNGAKSKIVNRDKPLYVNWLAESVENVPAVVEYLAPPPPAPDVNWQGFEDWAEVNMLGKIASKNATIVFLVMYEVVTNHYEGLKSRLQKLVAAGLLSFTTEEIAAMNAAANDYHIGGDLL